VDPRLALSRAAEAPTVPTPTPMQDWMVSERYLAKHRIGHGSFGEIYLGLDTMTNEDVSVAPRAGAGARASR
jgi:hypothetical protein